MNSFQLQELIKNIQRMIRCPNCGNSYKRENVNFLGQLGQAVLVQLDCYSCKMPVMATIVVSNIKPVLDRKGDYSNTESEFTGLIEERPTSANLDNPISTDELLDLHQFLNKFDGDFKKMFKE